MNVAAVDVELAPGLSREFADRRLDVDLEFRQLKGHEIAARAMHEWPQRKRARQS